EDGQTCGMVEQLQRRFRHSAMVDLEHGDVSYNIYSRSSFSMVEGGKPMENSSKKLKKILFKKKCKGLAKALAPQKSPLPQSLANAVTQASIRLADAIHASDSSSRLLGAVTSIEILLADQLDGFEMIQRRVLALLGNAAGNRYNSHGIL